jgi:hypothetical protein
MTQAKESAALRVENGETLAAFLKRARIVWRAAQPGPARRPGRPSQRQADIDVITAIAGGHAGVAGPPVKIWTQHEWVNMVGRAKGEPAPGKATIKKHLKECLVTMPVGIQQIPATIVRLKPLNEQLRHWYSVAVFEAILSDRRVAQEHSFRILRDTLNARHEQLCHKHIPKKNRRLQITEAERQAWFARQWARSTVVPVERRVAPAP